MVSASGSEGDASACEDVAFRGGICGERSGCANAPVDVVGAGASCKYDLHVLCGSQRVGRAEDKDGPGGVLSVQGEIARGDWGRRDMSAHTSVTDRVHMERLLGIPYPVCVLGTLTLHRAS